MIRIAKAVGSNPCVKVFGIPISSAWCRKITFMKIAKSLSISIFFFQSSVGVQRTNEPLSGRWSLNERHLQHQRCFAALLSSRLYILQQRLAVEVDRYSQAGFTETPLANVKNILKSDSEVCVTLLNILHVEGNYCYTLQRCSQKYCSSISPKI